MGHEESKQVDATGEVVNSIIVNSVAVQNDELKAVLYALLALRVIEFVIKLYKIHQNYMKKKYNNSSI